MLFSNLFKKSRSHRRSGPVKSEVPISPMVRDDLMSAIRNIYELHPGEVDFVHRSTVGVVGRSGAEGKLYKMLMGLTATRFSERRASHIAHHLSRRAVALITDERQAALGAKEAVWLHSGAPCYVHSREPTPADLAQDEAHRAVANKRYTVGRGMLIGGQWTLPGREDGCRCLSNAVERDAAALPPKAREIGRG